MPTRKSYLPQIPPMAWQRYEHAIRTCSYRCGYRRILKAAAIQIPRHGVLNLHSGLLPAYKGLMATFWATLNGEEEIGCTLLHDC